MKTIESVLVLFVLSCAAWPTVGEEQRMQSDDKSPSFGDLCVKVEEYCCQDQFHIALQQARRALTIDQTAIPSQEQLREITEWEHGIQTILSLESADQKMISEASRLRRVADRESSLGRFEDATRTSFKAARIVNDTLGKQHVLTFALQGETLTYSAMAFKNDDVREMCDSYKRKCIATYGKNCLMYVRALTAQHYVHRSEENWKSAIETGKEIASITGAICPNSAEHVVSLNLLTAVQLEGEDLAGAKESSRAAFDIIEHGDLERFRMASLSVFLIRGQVQLRAGGPNAAIVTLDRATKVANIYKRGVVPERILTQLKTTYVAALKAAGRQAEAAEIEGNGK